MNKQTSPKIDEGSLNFWIKPHQIKYDDNNTKRLVQVNPDGGSILIVKDDDNLVKFFHVYLGKGRTDVQYDVSKLNSSEPHMFTATWSILAGENKLFIDGELVAKTKLIY
jgi:hypothetical protein